MVKVYDGADGNDENGKLTRDEITGLGMTLGIGYSDFAGTNAPHVVTANSAVAFRHLYSRIVDPRGVVDLLVLNEKSPRSLVTETAAPSSSGKMNGPDRPIPTSMPSASTARGWRRPRVCPRSRPGMA